MSAPASAVGGVRTIATTVSLSEQLVIVFVAVTMNSAEIYNAIEGCANVGSSSPVAGLQEYVWFGTAGVPKVIKAPSQNSKSSFASTIVSITLTIAVSCTVHSVSISSTVTMY